MVIMFSYNLKTWWRLLVLLTENSINALESIKVFFYPYHSTDLNESLDLDGCRTWNQFRWWYTWAYLNCYFTRVSLTNQTDICVSPNNFLSPAGLPAHVSFYPEYFCCSKPFLSLQLKAEDKVFTILEVAKPNFLCFHNGLLILKY